MEIFETVKQVASDVATVSAKQSKKLYAIAKLKLEIIEKQNIVKNLHKQIGIDAYEAYTEKEDIVKAIKSHLKKIALAESEIEELRHQITMVKTESEETEYEASDDEYESYDEESEEYDEYDEDSEDIDEYEDFE